jgi:hypothetical protein
MSMVCLKPQAGHVPAFRTRFGMTPSEARHEGAQSVLADRRLAQVQARFVEYVQQLSAMDRSSN